MVFSGITHFGLISILVTTPILLQIKLIAEEERQLKNTFGENYMRYTQTTNRWFSVPGENAQNAALENWRTAIDNQKLNLLKPVAGCILLVLI